MKLAFRGSVLVLVCLTVLFEAQSLISDDGWGRLAAYVIATWSLYICLLTTIAMILWFLSSKADSNQRPKTNVIKSLILESFSLVLILCGFILRIHLGR